MATPRTFPGLSLVILVSASDSVFSGTEKRFLAKLVARLSHSAPGALRSDFQTGIQEAQASQLISELSQSLSAQCGGFSDRQKQLELAGAMGELLDEEEFLLWTGVALITGESDAKQSDFSQKANSVELEFLDEVVSKYLNGLGGSAEKLKIEAERILAKFL